MGEHFSAITEPFPSPLMFLAGLVPQTKNLTFGTAVINLPNHHPAIVAGEVAQFDHMSGGRFHARHRARRARLRLTSCSRSATAASAAACSSNASTT